MNRCELAARLAESVAKIAAGRDHESLGNDRDRIDGDVTALPDLLVANQSSSTASEVHQY